MIEPLATDEYVTLEQAREKLDEVRRIFEGYQAQYLPHRQTDLPSDALKDITDCFGVLLPLVHQDSVQRELLSKPADSRIVFYQIGDVFNQIGIYLSGFPNTGVTLLEGSGFID